MSDFIKPSCVRCGSVNIQMQADEYLRCGGCGARFTSTASVPMVTAEVTEDIQVLNKELSGCKEPHSGGVLISIQEWESIKWAIERSETDDPESQNNYELCLKIVERIESVSASE